MARRMDLQEQLQTALILTMLGVVNALPRRNIWPKIFGDTSI